MALSRVESDWQQDLDQHKRCKGKWQFPTDLALRWRWFSWPIRRPIIRAIREAETTTTTRKEKRKEKEPVLVEAIDSVDQIRTMAIAYSSRFLDHPPFLPYISFDLIKFVVLIGQFHYV